MKKFQRVIWETPRRYSGPPPLERLPTIDYECERAVQWLHLAASYVYIFLRTISIPNSSEAFFNLSTDESNYRAEKLE